MAPRPLRKVSGTGRRLRAPYRRWTLALAALTATLLVGTFLQPAGSTAATAAAPTTFFVYGWPGQSGLKVWRHICDDGRVPPPDWDFQTVTGGPPPFGPEAVGWKPKPGGGAYGIETYFPSAPDVDIFQIETYAPGGQTSGWARVDYSPRPGNVDYIGVIEDFVDTQPGWHTIDASDWQYDWYPYIGDERAGDRDREPDDRADNQHIRCRGRVVHDVHGLRRQQVLCRRLPGRKLRHRLELLRPRGAPARRTSLCGCWAGGSAPVGPRRSGSRRACRSGAASVRPAAGRASSTWGVETAGGAS